MTIELEEEVKADLESGFFRVVGSRTVGDVPEEKMGLTLWECLYAFDQYGYDYIEYVSLKFYKADGVWGTDTKTYPLVRKFNGKSVNDRKETIWHYILILPDELDWTICKDPEDRQVMIDCMKSNGFKVEETSNGRRMDFVKRFTYKNY